MHRTRTLRAVPLLLAFALLVAACGGGRSDDNADSKDNGSKTSDSTDSSGGSGVDTSDCPDNDTAGIDGDTITLASSFPQSGLTSAFAQISKGYKAYFAKLNQAGGVEVDGKKYKIEVVDKDDEYNASKTVQNINEEVGTDGDKAFAVFNVVGTANNVAIRESLDESCVPNLFAATGSPAWGNPDFPWLVGSTLAPYTLEAVAYANYLKDEQPDAKVAMLVQDDDFGKAYEEGFKDAIKGTKITVTKVATYPTGSNEVASQVTSLAATGADAFFDGATLLACPNALEEATSSNWERTSTFVSGTCISKTLMGLAGQNADGVLATTNIKDPLNPAFKDDAAMKEYRATLAEFGDDKVDPDNGIVAYGYTQAALLQYVLEQSPKLTRSSVLDTLRTIDTKGLGLLIDGVDAKMSADDPYLAENLQLIQYDAGNKYFTNVGDVIDFEGKTADLTPKDLIDS
ncbi:ABC transporter substrate-binding protein [Aquihabitans sp. G128]|uniref:ABC transporter substrate-binding protein n=1 Tax=Aquihabitans sp. G128 TaxID=2849779 RepID=UPI001C215925|nr:ABC transporter substrate-binding protein [Aquihabitans sp. G128]QXC60462.1 ABC transporter substrate-binding protein [Aquihabitans sp. G128]